MKNQHEWCGRVGATEAKDPESHREDLNRWTGAGDCMNQRGAEGMLVASSLGTEKAGLAGTKESGSGKVEDVLND